MINTARPRRLPAALTAALSLVVGMATVVCPVVAAAQTITDDQAAITQKLRTLRKLPDTERGPVTRQLALDIRKLPDPAARLNLASGLANLSTEGDFGHDTLQEVALTLAEALRTQPAAVDREQLSGPYSTLAQLVRYENVTVAPEAPELKAALARLEADDRKREQTDFTLTDLAGKSWNLKSLRGRVVMVNFWATWCPPCRKEIPDLDALYKQFKDQGLVILGISDEEMAKVGPFVAQNAITYPILLDPGRKVTEQFGVEGIPRTLIYDRNGKLAAQSIDMRTHKQFLDLLARAGLR